MKLTKLEKRRIAASEKRDAERKAMLAALSTDRERALFEALDAAREHLECCGYAQAEGLEARIDAALGECWLWYRLWTKTQ